MQDVNPLYIFCRLLCIDKQGNLDGVLTIEKEHGNSQEMILSLLLSQFKEYL